MHGDMRQKEGKRTELEDSRNKEKRAERKYKTKHTRRLGKDERRDDKVRKREMK